MSTNKGKETMKYTMKAKICDFTHTMVKEVSSCVIFLCNKLLKSIEKLKHYTKRNDIDYNRPNILLKLRPMICQSSDLLCTYKSIETYGKRDEKDKKK